jgi:hypothetical protein
MQVTLYLGGRSIGVLNNICSLQWLCSPLRIKFQTIQDTESEI